MVSATEKQVKERPILFSAPMIKAILEGRKTQTRRVLKRPSYVPENYILDVDLLSTVWWKSPDVDRVGIFQQYPYGTCGDRLWCKETIYGEFENRLPKDKPIGTDIAQMGNWWYAADHDESYPDRTITVPSIFMPRWASRINLLIKDIRVEKLQEISEEDAIAEGVPDHYIEDLYNFPVAGEPAAILNFHHLWDSINKSKGFDWNSNPWVWVVSFRRVV